LALISLAGSSGKWDKLNILGAKTEMDTVMKVQGGTKPTSGKLTHRFNELPHRHDLYYKKEINLPQTPALKWKGFILLQQRSPIIVHRHRVVIIFFLPLT
jgi:hypothetical protein